MRHSIAVLVFLGLIISIGFATDYTSCTKIQTSGSHRLTADVSGSNVYGFFDACIYINASNVVFNCNGHTITGTNASSTYGVIAYFPNVTIENCPGISSYPTGISIGGSITVVNSTVAYGTYGIVFGSGNTIANNSVHDEADCIYTGSDNNLISGNTLSRCSYIGIFDQEGVGNKIVGNTVQDSLYSIYMFGDYNVARPSNCVVANNTAINGTGEAYVVDRVRGCVYTNNTADGRGTGGEGFIIYADQYGPTGNNSFINNSVYNGTTGFDIAGYDATYTTSSNNFIGNSVHDSGWWPGIAVSRYCYNNSFSGNHIYNNTPDLLAENDGTTTTSYSLSNDVFDSPAGDFSNYTNLSLSDTLPSDSSYSISWSAQPATPPILLNPFVQKYINITPISGSVSIDSMTWSWNSTEASGYNESRLGIYEYNGIWVNLNGTLNTSAHTLKLSSVSPSSVYGIMEGSNDTTPPTVALDSPNEGYTATIPTIAFNFTPTDDVSTTMICSIYVNGTLKQTNYSVLNNTLTTFNVGVFTNGPHDWQVRCTDGSANLGLSQTRNFTTNLPVTCMHVTSSGTTTMTQDALGAPFNTPGGKACIYISASNVLFNCNGHSITNDGTPNAIGILIAMVNNVTVQNCPSVSGYRDGAYLYSSGSDNILYSDFSGNDRAGIYLDHSPNNILLHNNITGSQNGFYAFLADNNQIGYNNIFSTYSSNYLAGGASCPMLYTYNGTGYEFQQDIGVSGGLGKKLDGALWEQHPFYTNPALTHLWFEDYAKIPSNDLVPVNGTYSINVKEEFQEVDYIDKVALMEIDHDSNTNVYPDIRKNGVMYTVDKNAAPAYSVSDNYGDVSAELSQDDGVFWSSYYNASPSYLDIKLLGQNDTPSNLKLVFSMVRTNPQEAYGANITQLSSKRAEAQFLNQSGQWQALPADRQISTLVYDNVSYDMTTNYYGESHSVFDLSGLNITDNRIRLVIYDNSKIWHIDQLLVDTSAPRSYNITTLLPESADLHFKGASELQKMDPSDPYSAQTALYDDITDPNGINYQLGGNATKYGDVNPLLSDVDDEYVIMTRGDELGLGFNVTPMQGAERDFILYMYEYYKQSSKPLGHTIGPLPFQNMSGYPYNTSIESYPTDADHQAYLSTWNTRQYNSTGTHTVGISLPNSLNNTVFNNNISGEPGSYGLDLFMEQDTTIINNSISRVGVGIDIETSMGINASGNNISGCDSIGILIYDSDQTSLVNNYFRNNTNDFVAQEDNGNPIAYHASGMIFDNPSGGVSNYTNLSISDSLSSEIYSINWSGQPDVPPDNLSSFRQEFVNITPWYGTSPSIDFINWSWTETEALGYNESSFRLYQYDSGGWADTLATLNEPANTLSLSNLVPASIYGILGNTTGGAEGNVSVALESPAAGYNATRRAITFNCSANASLGLSTITLYGNFTGSWQANKTNSVGGLVNSTTFTLNLSYARYSWNCLAYDTDGNPAWAPANYTFTADSLPLVSNFGGSTTDFNSALDLQNVSTPILENPTYGKLQWNGSGLDVAGADFNSYVLFGRGWVSVDSSHLSPTLNSSANITLYNLTYVYTPVVYADGTLCTSNCQILLYAGHDLTFTVQHFTNYSSGPNTNLAIYDQYEGSNVSKLTPITFYANYTNATDNSHVAGATCTISFDDATSGTMVDTGSQYNYTKAAGFSTTGIHLWNVTCNETGYETLFAQDDVDVGPLNLTGNTTSLYMANVTNATALPRFEYNGSGNLSTEGGNISGSDIYTEMLTDRWAAFYGNITGSIMLTDKAGANDVYQWGWTPASGGVVCTSTNSSVTDLTLYPADGDDIDAAWSFAPTEADSGRNTFNQTGCDLTIGTTPITNAGYADTGQPGGFVTCSLKDTINAAKQDMYFCTNITQNGVFWNNQVGDFELMVPTTFGSNQYETYYFYVNLD